MIKNRNIHTLMRPLALIIGLALTATPALAGSLSDKLDNLQLSGFVDTSYSGTNAKGPTAASTGFGLDQVELDIVYKKDNIGLRFDLNGFPSAGTATTGDTLFEQGYITYTIPNIADDGVTFTFGKFNAPIGWELLDAPDMYQFSHALVFSNGIPTNLTGASLAAKIGMVDGVVYYSNKVDVNGISTTGVRSAGGRLGITPIKGANIGISYLNTTNPGLTSDKTIDIDFTYDAIDHLVIGGEYNQTKTSITRTGGVFATVHYDFTEMFGATYRFGTWDGDQHKPGKLTANTFAVTSVLGDGLGALAEYRTVNNTSKTIMGSENFASNFKTHAYAFEMTYAF
ncbi:MAG: porin [Mariprofundales bacterium]|nr:porin [Mariprofundales bacterium]